MKTNVGVVFGGRSVENEISVVTANQMMHAMDPEKYNIIPIYITIANLLFQNGGFIVNLTTLSSLTCPL